MQVMQPLPHDAVNLGCVPFGASAFQCCPAPGVSLSSRFSPQDKGKERLFPAAFQRLSRLNDAFRFSILAFFFLFLYTAISTKC
jgi:hypothetical protein